MKKEYIQITESDHSSIAAKEKNAFKHSDPEDVQKGSMGDSLLANADIYLSGENGSSQNKFTLRALQPPKRPGPYLRTAPRRPERHRRSSLRRAPGPHAIVIYLSRSARSSLRRGPAPSLRTASRRPPGAYVFSNFYSNF